MRNLFLLLLLLLLFLPVASALDIPFIGDNSTGIAVLPSINFNNGRVGCSSVSPFDFGKILSCGMYSAFSEAVIAGVGALQWFVNIILSLMLHSLDINALKPNYNAVRTAAMSALSVLIALLGLYWIWGARTMEGRMNAKIWSEQLIALIILESVGFFLIKMAVGLDDYIVTRVSSQLTGEMFNIETSGTSLIVLAAVILWGGISVVTTLITFIVRQMLLGALVVCFPFTLMLYLTPPTNKWGSVALNLTLAVIFLGAVNALALYGGSAAANMVGLFEINEILRPMVMYSILGLVGVLDIYILLMVPGLSRGVGATTIVHNVVSGFAPKLEGNLTAK